MKEKNIYINTSYINKNGIDYKVAVTRKKANKRTQIYCENNHVIWRQIYPLGHSPISTEEIICQPSTYIESDKVCILVIAGKPDVIAGLEEGIFLSARSWGIFDFSKLYVMSEKAFSELNL